MEIRDRYQERSERDFLPIPFSAYRLNTFPNQQHIPLHWHRELEITYIESPGWIEIEGESFPHQAGDIICVNKGLLHRSYTEEAKTAYLLVFDLDLLTSPFTWDNKELFLNQMIEGKLLLPEVVSSFESGYETLKELIALSYRLRKTETDEFYRYDYDVLLKKLFIEISRNAAGKQKAHGNKYIVLATNYIYNNYNKPLSLDSVASFTGVTPRYLQSLFKQTYNQTIIAKLTEYRLQKACELLKQTDYGIAHIAQTVGYNNFRAFLAAFTKHIGTTPSAYRKQNRVDCFIYDFGSNSTTGNVVVWERHDP